MFGWIILFSVLGSVFSMAGGVLLLWQQELARRFSLFLVSFAAGVLLGVAFLDLLPEAFEQFGDITKTSLFALIAISALFTIERFLWWYHHHRFDAPEHMPEHRERHTTHRAHAYLLLIGDGIHNFVDGVVIAAAFLVSFPLGVGVALGIIAHELPQEVADFAVMLNAGFSRLKTFILNLAVSFTTLLGAVLGFFMLSVVEGVTPYILALAVGVFTYIALSDLIPEIHHRSEHKHDVFHFLLFGGGIALIFFL